MKKVNFTKTPVEYELAPYEMLMSDIQKGPRLNKIMVDGELPPRLKKDAHDIILQFIKARPPLKPVRKKNMTIVVNIVLLKFNYQLTTLENLIIAHCSALCVYLFPRKILPCTFISPVLHKFPPTI